MHFRMYDRGMRYIFLVNISLKIIFLDFYFVEPPHLKRWECGKTPGKPGQMKVS